MFIITGLGAVALYQGTTSVVPAWSFYISCSGLGKMVAQALACDCSFYTSCSCVVSGHDFSRADDNAGIRGFSPCTGVSTSHAVGWVRWRHRL
jgi:hypothetical protein